MTLTKPSRAARRQRIDDLTTFAVPEQPALSPDGNECLYVLRTCDAEADRNVRAIWRVGTRTGRPRQLTHGTADTSPAWSPDGGRIAFLRSRDEVPQIWLLPADGGEAGQLTTLPLGAGAPVWSPDGSKIAFVAVVDPLAAGSDGMSPEVRASAPLVADRLTYQEDGAGLLGAVRRHLHVLDLATGRCRQVTEGDWHANHPAWSPDSKRLAFAAAMAPDADLRARMPLYVLDVSGEPAKPEPAGLPDGCAGPILWTPDATALLVVGTAGEPAGHARLLRVPLDGGAPDEPAAALDRNVMPGGPGYPGALPQFGDDGRTVLFCARDRGCTHLYAVSAEGGTPRPLVAGAGRNVMGLSVAGDTAVMVLGTPASFGEIVTVDLATGAEAVRTEHGAGLADVELFPREEREFTVSDGTVVQGWLIHDPAVEGPRPLLLDIHGGPHNAWNGAANEVELYHQELVARGWAVLLLNPRGSDGYGEHYWNAAVGAWGEADAKDLLEPIDDLVAAGIADPARLAVSGYSYGGYLTCYLTSRDDRFAAAVTGGVISDLVSLTGTADDAHVFGLSELGALPWTAPDRYAAMSPLTRVDQVRTPTLILHGAADLGCPVGQAQQWHTALRGRGVPTRLVLYPEASHLFVLDGPPSQRIDFNRRVVDWVEQYAGSSSGPARPRLNAAHWQRRLTTLAEHHHVPGATLGILRMGSGREDELAEAAYGVLNKDTGVGTTTDSVFQIGSITKVWTATVVMQLVDEGLLRLDTPIAEVLPELRLSEPAVAKRVTMRHLLTHTSGIDGDVFTDTGRGDDCLEKYVALLAGVAQNHPPDATWSYCNAGFSLAGRVIEKLTGDTWDEAIRKRLFTPLGLERTVTLPEEALLHRTAVGHMTDGGGEPMRALVWGLPRAVAPADLISSTVADVLTFARMHLAGGAARDGTRLLTEASAEAMADSQVELPDHCDLADSWGLGWSRIGWDGRRLLGHDGSTIGQDAYLRLLPDERLAVALLTNGGDTTGLYEDLFGEIFAELADIAMPPPLGPPALPLPQDVRPHLGTYERAGVRMEVLDGDDGPILRTTVTGPPAELTPGPETEQAMVPVKENLFVVHDPETRSWAPVTFYALPTGERYLYVALRATPKAD
ncbi:serine hydrolase (plasmid) [Streptomyces sp. NBC_01590]|uniref:serine hydrolase n=1 Tax=Streptomyces sp. NBC_01590 TaxID=2975887 RepID=UPI0038654C8D